MTTEPTPLVTVLPCDRDTVILIGHHEGWEWDENAVRAGRYDDDETIQLVARHRLAAREAAAKVADDAATHWNGLAWDRRNGGLDDTHCCAKASASTELATAIRALSNKTGEGSGSGEMELYGWQDDGKPLYRPKGFGKVLRDALAHPTPGDSPCK